MGLPDERVYTALRFGIGRYNSGAEIDDVVESLAAAVIDARARSSPVPR
jgi:cysteine sulfinate desulfinase/cysteine desulfurase-like protein